jgi:Na+-translocating ferredoxin:NAD+ oxidoreductase RnfG subunit
VRPIPSLLVVPAALVAAAIPAYAADYLTIPQAQQILFPDAERFLDASVELNDKQRTAIEKLSGVRQRWKKQTVWRAEKAGALLGWLIVDDVVGKHEFITYAAALSPDAKVLGIEILSYRETHGHQVRSADWRRRFVGKTLAEPFKLDQDIPNISGATLSCRNLTDGVKRLLALHEVMLSHGP